MSTVILNSLSEPSTSSTEAMRATLSSAFENRSPEVAAGAAAALAGLAGLADLEAEGRGGSRQASSEVRNSVLAAIN